MQGDHDDKKSGASETNELMIFLANCDNLLPRPGHSWPFLATRLCLLRHTLRLLSATTKMAVARTSFEIYKLLQVVHIIETNSRDYLNSINLNYEGEPNVLQRSIGDRMAE